MSSVRKYFKRVNTQIDPDKRSHPNRDGFDNNDVNPDIDDQSVDSYKIITTDTEIMRPFLIYGMDENDLVLNSGSLIRLLDLKGADRGFLEKLLDIRGAYIGINIPTFTEDDRLRYHSIYKWFTELEECASILKESRIFYNFDPYCNFLLSKTSTMKDVKDIIKKTTSADLIGSNRCANIDFANMVNPYGLEKVVFTGGGTKGHIYIGTTIALLATGQIFYLNHYSGTSIGGLSAMVASCITPSKREYQMIKEMKLKEIMTRGVVLVRRYQRAVEFATARFCEREMDTFYEKPNFSYYGLWTMASKIMRKNGLYDPEESGFQVWYALICMRICQIMINGLDKKIIIKDDNGKIIRFIEEFSDEDHRYTESMKGKRKQKQNRETDQKSDQNSDVVVVEGDTYADADADKQEESIFSSFSSDDQDYRDIKESEVDTLEFVGWTVELFYTFTEYYEATGKTIVFTGTKTDPVETVYYSHTDSTYSELTVLSGARASMSIPWVFEAPIINGSYHLDGGLYDNYPLTHTDITTKGKIKYYNNRVFGYLIDDQNSIIDAYEVIRELWLVYVGFLQIMNIGYLSESPNFDELSRLFFEIRAEVYKMLYFADTEIETFLDSIHPDELNKSVESYNVTGLRDIFNDLRTHMTESDFLNFKLARKGANYVVECMTNLRGAGHTIGRRDSTASDDSGDSKRKFKIGRMTDLADIMDLAFQQGVIYNELTSIIRFDLMEIKKLNLKGEKMKIVKRYERILNHLMRDILSYYEVKGTFVRNNDLDQPCRYFIKLLKKLNTKLREFDTMTKNATESLRKSNPDRIKKNYIQQSIDIGLMMISKIVTRGSGNDHDIEDIQSSQAVKSSYQKVVDYFFHTDMTGILYKYMCIANDRICNDIFNQMRTIKLNTFETNTLHFDIDRNLKSRLIYEGYSKTIKYFTNLLRIMEMTKRYRSTDEFVPSYEIRYKSMHK